MTPTSSRPNIILLILDTLRARNMSCYGYEVNTTPCLDGFARENILFSRAFSPATWTVPTHASLLSGLYLSQHRIENVEGNRRFNKKIVTLPAALRPAGYDTVAFSQNILFSSDHNFDSFDTFFEASKWSRAHPFVRVLKRLVKARKGTSHRVVRYVEKMTGARLLLDAMRDWAVQKRRSEPFFLMANLGDPHYAWTPPPRMLARYLRFNPTCLLKREYICLEPWQFNPELKQVTPTHRRVWSQLYNATVSHVDREVGRFLKRLKRWEGWENTIVVITSDHGEMLGDYRDIVGHMLSLHDNLIHVPLIVRHPDYPSGSKVEGVVQTLDLYPSIVEWAGLIKESGPSAQLQRPSLTRAMSAPEDAGGYAFAEEDYTDSYNPVSGLRSVNPNIDPKKYPTRQVSVHSAKHKYIWCDDRPGEFYDLETDPYEQENLMGRLDDNGKLALNTLQQAMNEWQSNLEMFPPETVDDAPQQDEEVLRRLRGLGYIA